LKRFNFSSLVATVITGDVDNEKVTKPSGNEPEDEEEIEQVIFSSYYVSGKEVEHKV
jgi:hypothetical protein